ncbi:MAG: hypothetical protein Q4D62_02205 [Planctomycetia bacterium]|nr:hypothetical protein [Planctomycetia bacterium]
MQKILGYGLLLAGGLFSWCCGEEYVRVSPANPQYLEWTDGTPYIPVGVNLCILRDRDASGKVFLLDDEAALQKLEFYFQKLSENGGNYARIWLGIPPFEVEKEKAGEFDAGRLENMKKMFALAKKYGIQLKLCLEYFRTLEPRVPYAFGVVSFGKPIYKTSPPANMQEFTLGEVGKEYYLNRCAFLAQHFQNETAVFAWELWNEVNCIPNSVVWTETMLPQVHAMFPHQMVIQSLGSYDSPGSAAMYQKFAEMEGNEILQVHRYLDMGAKLEVCHGPMDILAADCVRAMRQTGVQKPILATELGAVQPNHAGPSELYAKDREGILFHDILFAPFFAGAAGPGHCWHWNVYLEKQNLWWHIGRFSKAIAGLNPIQEAFEPFFQETPQVRMYGLRGKKTTLIWIRDTEFDWKKELEENRPATTRENLKIILPRNISLQGKKILGYDPWTDQEITLSLEDGSIVLPKFRRSFVIRIQD